MSRGGMPQARPLLWQGMCRGPRQPSLSSHCKHMYQMVTSLQVFMDLGLLTEAELEAVLVSEFNPVRMGFRGITEITTRDVLNCGASPERLLDIVKQRFLDAGGCASMAATCHLLTSCLLRWILYHRVAEKAVTRTLQFILHMPDYK